MKRQKLNEELSCLNSRNKHLRTLLQSYIKPDAELKSESLPPIHVTDTVKKTMFDILQATTMAQVPTSSALRALSMEYKSLQEEPVEGFRVKLVNDDNLFEWEVAIFGPPDTLYQGGYFKAIIEGELPHWDVNVQNQIENLTKTFEASSFISAPLYTESWLRSFVSYVRRNQDFLNVTIDTREGFLKTLNDLWLFKPNPFSLDIKFNDDGTKIIASRFMIQAVNITDGNMEKEMVKELRRIAHESSLNVSVFHPYFVFFDQFELVRPTTIQSMLGGSVTMMFISFIFIPNNE
ncbi:patched domain-containing protein 1-like [Diaphorina citri]|uniref:Patched domain-containing protein 1-like n=1 Tax=Diaphorina citri TaxID=121845 RepID=A0A3Q0INA5_DIACI|nr:patched domain-containing protein 1-like [Diaphorina citri]